MYTKIYCDIAEINLIKKFNKKKIVKGFTTNPSLMRKAGAKNYKSYSKKILKICNNKPVSLEVFADEYTSMKKQALQINTWGKNVYVKIPVVNSKGIFIEDGVIKAKSDLPIFDNSLGMSISGIYGFSKLTNIEGTLVPLASINMVPSKIPLIGELFKGDNKGEGLIGIKYRIYEDENGLINIQSNPLSILTPGILQRIF